MAKRPLLQLVDIDCRQHRSTPITAPWIDLRGCREKAQPVSHLDDVGIQDLFIRTSRDHLKEITIRSNRRMWQMPKLKARQLSLMHFKYDPIDLDGKTARAVIVGLLIDTALGSCRILRLPPLQIRI